MKKFLVVVTSENVRDTQVALVDGADYMDDSLWKDYDDGEVVVGTFEANTEEEAITKASEYMSIEEDTLSTYELVAEG